MGKEPTREELESVSSEQRAGEPQEPYTPRPRWQLAAAWIMLAIVVLGIINLCYWQFTT